MRKKQNTFRNSAGLPATTGLTALLLLCSTLIAGCATGKVAQKHPGLMYQTVNSASYPVLYPVMQDAARKGLPPMRVTFDGADAPASDYHLDLAFSVRDKGMHQMEWLWALGSFMSLGQFPATCGHFEVMLTASLEDRQGRQLRSWQVMENDTAFTWLLMTHACDGPDQDSMQKILASLLDELFTDMGADPVFAGAPPGAVVSPLVFIDVGEDSRAIVERAVWTGPPFTGITFDEGARQLADRIITLELEYQGPKDSIARAAGRGFLAGATLFMVSVCPPSTLTVRATVRDAKGQTLHQYEDSKKLRNSVIEDCAPVSAGMRPEAETKLLQRLFRRMAEDLQGGRG